MRVVHAHANRLAYAAYVYQGVRLEGNKLLPVVAVICKGIEVGFWRLTELAGPIWKSLASCGMSAGWPAARPSSTLAVTVLCDLPCSAETPCSAASARL